MFVSYAYDEGGSVMFMFFFLAAVMVVLGLAITKTLAGDSAQVVYVNGGTSDSLLTLPLFILGSALLIVTVILI